MPDGIPFQRQVIDDDGKPVTGALISAFLHETRTPEPLYHDPACTVPTTIPLKAKIGGRVNAYHRPGVALDIVTADPETGFIFEFVTIGGALPEKPPTQTVTQPVAETPASDPFPEPEMPTDGLSNGLAALEAAKARIDDRSEPEAEPDTPPEAIADMFQTDRPYAEQAAALWVVYNELTNKIMMKLATDADRTKHSRLQGELDWIKRHAFEAV